MARGRIIHPDFWTDGVMIGHTPFARLFYIGTWNFSLCDQGHLPDDPMGLKLKILPADPVDAVGLVDELLTSGRLRRITISDGRTFLWAPKFSEWQTSDTRNKPRCPVCRDTAIPAETHTGFDGTDGDSTNPTQRGGEGMGEEVEGRGSADGAPTPFCPKHPGGTTAPCRACGNAREARKAHDAAARSKPTARPVKAGECAHKSIHSGRCDDCGHLVKGVAA
ncbi:hypothetical protein [Agromyces aureus]|uniref:Uncharacterized protein n=1 Tax=Agromyces aureus TaxID=453304 RepID=A0A191WEW0_9MICO|nr:hypothetical protein [Agromyces aureus]ANJ26796.1 hypothetical protein ATC03_08785 [Agromyces aureus]